MNHATSSPAFFVGWDVGGWNCDRNRRSRDALVILDETLAVVGRPWRGNLRDTLNQAADTQAFLDRLFELCQAGPHPDSTHVTLAVDTPLGFSQAFIGLLTRGQVTEPIEGVSGANPYLYRLTERELFDLGLSPLSAVKDMIGSQATKGIHVLAKFAPTVASCGVWRGGASLTVLEAYPAACASSATLAELREQVADPPDQPDEKDALICALIAYLFGHQREQLLGPCAYVPESEGWIWVPKDIKQAAS